MDPIFLDQIDLVSDWVVEDEAPADLSWLDEETGVPLVLHFPKWKHQTHLHHSLFFNIVMLVLALLGSMLGDLLFVVMHETRVWTWRHYLFLISASYVLSYVFEL